MLTIHRSPIRGRLLLRDEAAQHGGLFISSSALFALGRPIVADGGGEGDTGATLFWESGEVRTLLMSYAERKAADDAATALANNVVAAFAKSYFPSMPASIRTRTVAGAAAAIVLIAVGLSNYGSSRATAASPVAPVPLAAVQQPTLPRAPSASPSVPPQVPPASPVGASTGKVDGFVELPE